MKEYNSFQTQAKDCMGMAEIQLLPLVLAEPKLSYLRRAQEEGYDNTNLILYYVRSPSETALFFEQTRGITS